jgi:sodium-dependent dicarboxylate transporter 2/3/5
MVKRIGLLAGPLIGAAAYALLPDSYRTVGGEALAFGHAGRATLAVVLWMATWWLTEAIDLEATALLPIVLFPLLGILPIRAAAAPYAADSIFLFMGGFILALSMQRWGLDRRIAILTLRIVGSNPVNMIGGFMLATAAISAFVSNTATAAMMLPIGLSVIELARSGPDPEAGDASRRNFATCLMLGIAYAASIGGVATIIGTPPNVFLVGFVRDTIHETWRRDIGFVQWLGIGLPLVAVFLPATWLLLTRVLYPVRLRAIEGGREFLREAAAELGPMRRGEWATLIVFLIAAALWIARPVIAFGWSAGAAGNEGELRFLIPPLVPGLSDAGIAMLAALALFVIPAGRAGPPSEPGRPGPVMNWRTARQLPWGVLILFGGGLSLAAAIESNGVAELIGHQTAHLRGVPPILVILVVTAAVVFFSEIASNTATAATLIPILAAMAPGLDMHPYMLVIPAALAASCAFMLPVGTPPNAMVFGTGHVTIAQMARAGLWLNLIGIGLIAALAYVVIGPLLVR